MEPAHQLEQVARDLTSGLDPTVRKRVASHFEAASKELQKAGMKVKEGSIVKGIGEGSSIGDAFGGAIGFESDLQPKTKKKMLRDPDVNFAMAALAGPIAGSEWSIECSDSDISAFLEGALRPVMQSILTSGSQAVAMGFQAFEKIYAIQDVEVRSGQNDDDITVVKDALTYKELYDVDPAAVEFVKKAGELVGFKVGKVVVPIDLTGKTIDKGAVVTMPYVKWGDYTGEGRLEQCYDPWWAKVNVTQFMLRYLERMGDPPIIGRAPKGTSTGMDGVMQQDNLDVMLNICKTVRGHGVVVLPFDIDPETKEQRWQMQMFEDSMRQSVFLEVLEHLSILIMRACLQPEKRLIEGKSVGAYAMVQVQSGVADMISLHLQKALFQQLSKQLLPPLVLGNFGPNAPQARIVPGAMSQENVDVLQEVLKEIVEYEKGNVPDQPLTSMIDRLELLKQLRLPTTASDEMETQEESESDRPDEDEVENTDSVNPEDPEGQGAMSVRLASTARSRRDVQRLLKRRAEEWKRDVADPILDEQIDNVTRQISAAYAKPTRASQTAAIKRITVPSGKYQKALQQYLEESYDIGVKEAAQDLGVKPIAQMPAADKQMLGAVSEGLAADRAGNIKRVANVAGLYGIQAGQTAKEVVYEIKQRAEKRLKKRSNQVTAVAEGWRGFHGGKRSGAILGAAETDPIVAAQFVASTDACPFCNDLDGQIIMMDNPAFFAYLPPQHHNCVCDVDYLKASEVSGRDIPRFERPSQENIDRYADEYFVPKELLSVKCGHDH